MMSVNEPATSRFDFGRIAQRYDAWYETPRGAMYDRLERRVVGSLLPSACNGRTLLDVGCGTGHWSEYFAVRGYEVTGVDISAETIAIARAKGIANGAFRVADGTDLFFADDSFDVAAAITVLEFVADPEAVLLEMVRCTRKAGGMLLIGVLNRLSPYNCQRAARPGSLYASAHLFDPSELRDLLAVYGEPTVFAAGFVPRRDSLVWLSPLLEGLGRLKGSEHGAFLAARVIL